MFDWTNLHYTKEKGDIIEYLRERETGGANNMFKGSEHFFTIRDRGIMLPEITRIRVGNSPAPDIAYFVNKQFMLESRGTGAHNMSMIGAPKGIYNPNEALKDRIWSIHGLKIWEE